MSKTLKYIFCDTVLKLTQVGFKVMVEFILRNSAKCPCKLARRGTRKKWAGLFRALSNTFLVAEKRGCRLFTKNIASSKAKGLKYWR